MRTGLRWLVLLACTLAARAQSADSGTSEQFASAPDAPYAVAAGKTDASQTTRWQTPDRKVALAAANTDVVLKRAYGADLALQYAVSVKSFSSRRVQLRLIGLALEVGC